MASDPFPPARFEAGTFPFEACGTVIHGLGRGSKELGIPTANLDRNAKDDIDAKLGHRYGIYYGRASFPDKPQGREYFMVMSFGLNPQYANQESSAEVHIMHAFESDFYGARLHIKVEGYIRPEKNFGSLDALIEQIHADIAFCKTKLASA